MFFVLTNMFQAKSRKQYFENVCLVF